MDGTYVSEGIRLLLGDWCWAHARSFQMNQAVGLPAGTNGVDQWVHARGRLAVVASRPGACKCACHL
jgi:hypothetical protein